MGNKTLYLYPHWFHKELYRNISRDMITNSGNDIEYIFDSEHIEKLDVEDIVQRWNKIYDEYQPERVKFVLMGYSPAVTACALAALKTSIPVEFVYFEEKSRGDFREVQLST